MKLIGKQIVVELPEKLAEYTEYSEEGDFYCHTKNDIRYYSIVKNQKFNEALSEVAKMNPAWEVDEKNLLKWFGDFNFEYFKTHRDSPPADVLIRALATNPSAWLKRKASDEAKEKV